MTIFTDLISNVALLLALSILYSFLTRIWKHGEITGQIFAGLLFGGVAVAGMIAPFHYGPGVIFDGRSIVVSMAGLFGGPVTAAISIIIAGGYRLGLGGTGALTGFSVIFTSAALGVCYYYLRRKNLAVIKSLYLFVFGVIVHISMLLLMLTLPWPLAFEVLNKISIPVMLIFPLGTLFLGILLVDQEERNYAQEALREREEKYRSLVEFTEDSIYLVDRNSTYLFMNEKHLSRLGLQPDEFLGRTYGEFHSEDDTQVFSAIVEKVFKADRPIQQEHRSLRDDKYFLRTLSPVKDPGDNTISITVVSKDITELVRSQEALRESEDKYRNLVEESFDGIFIQRGPNIVFANKRLNKMLGYEDGELIGQNHWLLYHPDYQKLTRERAQARMGGEEVAHRYEVKFQRKDDSWFYGEVNARAITFPHDEENGIQVWVKDIDERKQAEERLRFLSSAVEQSSEGMAVADMEGNLIYVNHAWVEMHGYESFEELTGRHLSIFHDSEQLKNEVKPFNEMVMENGYHKGEVGHICKDGKPFPTLMTTTLIKDESGKPIAFSGIAKDITDIKRAQEALRESEGKYRLLVENQTDLLVKIDREGKLRFVSPSYLKMFDTTEAELFGKTFLPVIHPDDREITAREMKKLYAPPHTAYVEQRVMAKDGWIWLAWLGTAVLDEEGRVTEIMGLGRDISDKKQAEIEKERLQSQLQQSQKMEAVGTLAGGIAHDFNNILAIILGNAELASDDVPDSNPASKSLEAIRLASIRAKEMVQQLLSFSRQTDQEKRPLNLVPIVAESMKMLRNAIPASVEFKTCIPDYPCYILGDKGKINQIVMNLATNAAQAMSEKGGLLDVTLENIVLQEETTCFERLLSPGSYAILKVRDTGGGINANIMNRVFEPYFTTKEVGKGTGMGLSVIHGLVKQHNGGIRVESELGKGTLFEVYFPVIMEKVKEEKTPKGKIEGGTEKILFVDDEPSIVDLNHQRLERLGYEVKSTTKPLEALEWFKADPNRFDVIITDMTMPRMTGDRLTKEILTIRPHMRVIICTGYSERMSEKKAVALGARKYIEKPMDTRKLAAALREVFEEN